MMQQLQEIYQNDLGVAFFWCKNETVILEKVQLVFKESGFYLSESDLLKFAHELDATCSKIGCSDCKFQNSCQRYLLRTPFEGMELAVSANEALLIKDLVEGALFQLQLSTYLNNLCKN
ncbi:hypothetical protein LZZ90_01470 [Flavobacterium sp. SM15]|uniref:hypothetical protein n=1 Tax=Flavobacterium sp. SM15 TaxID=2908005 RepID=UPI001EDA758B|nr:hypothetical protein [Flavobacterium sp. SM15]MCG2610171.1 hypothetical protein [Flavobacterium sp. SM15]